MFDPQPNWTTSCPEKCRCAHRQIVYRAACILTDAWPSLDKLEFVKANQKLASMVSTFLSPGSFVHAVTASVAMDVSEDALSNIAVRWIHVGQEDIAKGSMDHWQALCRVWAPKRFLIWSPTCSSHVWKPCSWMLFASPPAASWLPCSTTCGSSSIHCT